jgi:hypothetical protein
MNLEVVPILVALKRNKTGAILMVLQIALMVAFISNLVSIEGVYSSYPQSASAQFAEKNPVARVGDFQHPAQPPSRWPGWRNLNRRRPPRSPFWRRSGSSCDRCRSDDGSLSARHPAKSAYDTERLLLLGAAAPGKLDAERVMILNTLEGRPRQRG